MYYGAMYITQQTFIHSLPPIGKCKQNRIAKELKENVRCKTDRKKSAIENNQYIELK